MKRKRCVDRHCTLSPPTNRDRRNGSGGGGIQQHQQQQSNKTAPNNENTQCEYINPSLIIHSHTHNSKSSCSPVRLFAFCIKSNSAVSSRNEQTGKKENSSNSNMRISQSTSNQQTPFIFFFISVVQRLLCGRCLVMGSFQFG